MLWLGLCVFSDSSRKEVALRVGDGLPVLVEGL